jgi:CBS domain containing-hemolysin-like protein
MDTIAILFPVALGIMLSFLLSGMEAGVMALSPLRIRQQMRSGRRAAAVLNRYLEHPENFLWTILVGNTLATFSAFSLIVAVLYQRLGDEPVLFLFALGLLAFLFYALFDLLPKMLFRQFPNRLCLLLALPFRIIHLALSPLVWCITWFSNGLLRLTGGTRYQGHLFGTRNELRLVMQESGENLSSEERAMINRVLDLQNLTVRSLAVPWPRVVSVSTTARADEVLRLCREHHLTRLPVWREEGRTKRIAGVVSLRKVLYDPHFDPSRSVADLLRPAIYLREDLRLEEAFRRLQRKGQRLAIVLSVDGREIGVISLQDILKRIFGEVSL